MNLLPESVQNPFALMVPQSKAVSTETIARLPAPIASRRNTAFDSNNLFADPAGLESFVEQTHWDYYKLAQLFLCHDLCYTPITIKTQAQYGAELEVVRETASGIEVLHDHPFLQIINDPNDSMHDQDLFEAWTVHHNLWGKFMCLMIRENSLEDLANPNGKVIGLMPVRPDQIEKKYDGYGSSRKFIGYEFRITPYTKPQFVAPGSFMVDVYYNPITASLGHSPTKVASRWLSLDTSLTDSNRAFVDGGGMPALILSLNTQLPDGTFKKPETIKKELMQNKQVWDEQYKRGGNRFRKPAFVAGMNPFFHENSIESQMLDAFYNRIESRVARVYGVPAQSFMAGLEHGDSKANSGEANQVFAEQVVWTQLERMRLRLQRSSFFAEYTVKNEYLRWNIDNCKIFTYQKMLRDKSMREDFKLGVLTAKTLSETLGYPPLPKEMQDLNYFQLLAFSRTSSQTQIGNGAQTNTDNSNSANGKKGDDKSQAQ